MIVRWLETADTDLREIAIYLGARNKQAAIRVFQAIVTAADSLQNFPHRGRNGRRPGTREIVGFGPYVIVYRVETEVVTILRVWHSAQSRQD